MEKPKVKLIPLGVGNAFSAIHYYAHMLLIIDERRIQIDCPPYLNRMLREYMLRFNDKAFSMINLNLYRLIKKSPMIWEAFNSRSGKPFICLEQLL